MEFIILLYFEQIHFFIWPECELNHNNKVKLMYTTKTKTMESRRNWIHHCCYTLGKTDLWICYLPLLAFGVGVYITPSTISFILNIILLLQQFSSHINYIFLFVTMLILHNNCFINHCSTLTFQYSTVLLLLLLLCDL